MTLALKPEMVTGLSGMRQRAKGVLTAFPRNLILTSVFKAKIKCHTKRKKKKRKKIFVFKIIYYSGLEIK